MSEQTEVQQEKVEYPSQLFVSIAGNHPLAESAVASVLSSFFNNANINGRRQPDSAIEPTYAKEVFDGLAANQNNTINIMVNTMTLEALQGKWQEWDWPTWGDASQPWTALVDDSLRNLWPTFTSAQKRAIYNSFNALNIEVEGEDEPLTLEHALRIVHDESETYVRFNPNKDRTAFGSATVDGSFLDQAELHAILFVLNNAIPGKDEGDDEPRLRDQSESKPTVGGDVQPAPELEFGENPATNTAHPAPELPDGREVVSTPEPTEPAAGPEHNPEEVQLDTGAIPTVSDEDPQLAASVQKDDGTTAVGYGQSPVDFETTDASLAPAPASGSVVPNNR